MIINVKSGSKKTSNILAAFAFTAASVLSTAAIAQGGAEIRDQYPQLADLFNAFDVTQSNTYENIVAINNNPETQEAQDSLEKNLKMMANMSMNEMMAAAMAGAGMNMSGPYGELEVQARIALREAMDGQHSDDEAQNAFSSSTAINRHAAEVLRRGRNFENRLFAIYVDDAIIDKQSAVASAIENYLEDDQHSVATVSKDAGYLLAHPQATAFKSAYPRLSGLLWSNQWLQLAVLEAVIMENLDSELSGGVEIALERFWNKVGSAGGMTMFPAPSELPMAPTIAPDLYSQSPQAAAIIDNLNVMETVIADVLAYPNLEGREAIIDGVIAEYTNKEENLADSLDYLLFALRGGIYNQGGPAVGELMQSERNRSRSAMNMQHTMIMSAPQ